MTNRIYHQYRSTYVFVDEHNHDTHEAAVKALAAIGITEWDRLNFEPLHFDRDAYLTYGHHEKAEKLYGYRFVNVVRPEGMQNHGWHS